MANTIQHKRSSTSGVAPAASGLSQGELAINIADGKLYTKNNANSIINLGVTSISGTSITPSSGNFFNYLAVNGIPVSVSGHSHTTVPQAQSLVTNVFNKTASTIPKFSVVYIDGGQGDQPTIQLAIANSESGSSKTYGITAEAISSMSAGSVIVAGALTGIDTDQFNPTAPVGNVNGITLYLSPSVSGAATTTKPYAPNHLVSIGTIVRTHQNAGVVEVKIQNGFELQELHNVAVTGVAGGQFLYYDGSSDLWQPNSNIYSNGTNIGIGTNSPTVQLEVIGSIYSENILSTGYLVSNALLSVNDFDGGSPGTIYVGELTSLNQPYWTIDQNGSGNFSTLSVNDTLVSLNGHTHSSSDITNFNSAVSGLLPVIANSGDNRVLTSTGSSVGINAESDLTFDGTNLSAPRIIATQASADEGGELQLAKAPNSSISGAVIIDTYQNKLRFFEQSGSNRGFYLDLSAAGAGVSTNIGGGGSATTVSNYADNRIITSDGTTTGLNAETNFTFNGSLLNITGSGSFSNNIITSGSFIAGSGSASNPSFEFTGDPDTGMFAPAANTIALATSGVERLRISNVGNVGIGTTSPSGQLHVIGTGIFSDRIGLSTNNPASNFHMAVSTNNDYGNILMSGATSSTHVGLGGVSDTVPFLASISAGTIATSVYGFGMFYRNTEGDFTLSRKSGSTSWIRCLNIQRSNGFVGIGSGTQAIAPPEMLTVDGNLRLADRSGSTGNKIQFNRGGGTANDYTIGKEGNHLAISTANDGSTFRFVEFGYHAAGIWIPKLRVNGYTGDIIQNALLTQSSNSTTISTASTTTLFTIAIPATTATNFNIKISAYNATNSATASWNLRGLVKRISTGNCALVGDRIIEKWADSAFNTSTVDVGVSTTNIIIQATNFPASSTTVKMTISYI